MVITLIFSIFPRHILTFLIITVNVKKCKETSMIFYFLDINYESCFNKIKLLVLTSMASQCGSGYQDKTPSLCLKQVSEQLQLTIEQTESLAIQAINLGLINGKIDQMNSTLVVR
jgi:hypothetical protein